MLARLGPKRAEEGAYVWQKLMNDRRGDLERHGRARSRTSIPSTSYYATVTRRLKDGSVFFGDQKMIARWRP
ncbi:MAG: hypothetical protein M0C28_12230 [Candidatus Moduliflexus flocculans]|nr:hypothetical protein [Candidatus Moduliflexus flocculans]